MLRYLVSSFALLGVLAAGACGEDDRDSLTVSAAASLKTAFSAYGEDFDAAAARFSFAASDELAAQIRAGARPDVYAAANDKLPRALFDDGLVERPVAFASNRLVLAVPAPDARVSALSDLAGPGITIAVGAPTVPVGGYTRTVLARLPADQRRAILANVRSQEPDVAGVVGKVAQGAVDAGFVYVTDVAASDGRLKAIELPSALRPDVVYAAAVVTGTPNRRAARAFVDGLVDGPGARRLRDAGFGAP